MARMYPDSLDQSNPSAAERQLYYALRKQLGDDWVVFHGLQWVNEKEKRKASDADFVVLHPKHGLVCIEAKSGTMEHRDGRWYQQGEARKTDPFEQANRSMHELAKRIKDQTGISIRYAHGVAFPAVTQIAGVGPLNAHPSMAILSPDMKELEAAVVRMFEGVGQPRELDATKFEQVVDNLRAGFGLIETLHGRAIQQGHTLERLTEQQTLLLEVLGNRNRALIRGEAGSGKTELCVRQSVRLAEAIEDARVLVLTFNEPIAGELARRIGELSDRVEVVHFHGLARRYLEAAGVDWTPPTEPRDAVDDFYNFQIPEQFLAAVQQSADRYDAILVDEGQDFWDHWWEVVLQLLRDPQSGHLFIYFDPNQSIYGNEAGFPIEEEPIVLPTNCRSTRQIWEKCYAIRGVTNPKLRGDEPVGSEPRVLYSSSSADERALLQQELTRLVKDGDFRTDQVVVIGRLPFSQSVVADDPVLGEFEITPEGTDPLRPGQVRYMTIGRSKGLEWDCVIILGFQDLDLADELQQTRLYVAATRARHELSFILRNPRTLRIYGIPRSTSDSEFRALLEPYGAVVRTNLVPSKIQPDRQVGFVTFDSVAAAKTALEALSRHEMDGEILRAHFNGPAAAVDRLSDDPRIDSLYIKGLPSSVSDEELRARISQYGKVKSVAMKGPYPGTKTRGAVVEMESASSAAQVLDGTRDGLPLGARSAKVSRARSNARSGAPSGTPSGQAKPTPRHPSRQNTRSAPRPAGRRRAKRSRRAKSKATNRRLATVALLVGTLIVVGWGTAQLRSARERANATKVANLQSEISNHRSLLDAARIPDDWMSDRNRLLASLDSLYSAVATSNPKVAERRLRRLGVFAIDFAESADLALQADNVSSRLGADVPSPWLRHVDPLRDELENDRQDLTQSVRSGRADGDNTGIEHRAVAATYLDSLLHLFEFRQALTKEGVRLGADEAAGKLPNSRKPQDLAQHYEQLYSDSWKRLQSHLGELGRQSDPFAQIHAAIVVRSNGGSALARSSFTDLPASPEAWKRSARALADNSQGQHWTVEFWLASLRRSATEGDMADRKECVAKLRETLSAMGPMVTNLPIAIEAWTELLLHADAVDDTETSSWALNQICLIGPTLREWTWLWGFAATGLAVRLGQPEFSGGMGAGMHECNWEYCDAMIGNFEKAAKDASRCAPKDRFGMMSIAGWVATVTSQPDIAPGLLRSAAPTYWVERVVGLPVGRWYIEAQSRVGEHLAALQLAKRIQDPAARGAMLLQVASDASLAGQESMAIEATRTSATREYDFALVGFRHGRDGESRLPAGSEERSASEWAFYAMGMSLGLEHRQ